MIPTQEEAEAHAEAARTFIMNELITKEDLRTGLDEIRRDLEGKLETCRFEWTECRFA